MARAEQNLGEETDRLGRDRTESSVNQLLLLRILLKGHALLMVLLSFGFGLNSFFCFWLRLLFWIDSIELLQ